jgi:uncharacterized protein (DUF2235 family)
MGKNVLIFSDGTGQVGGIKFDEDRTNIYKLYRATRVGPDSCINPSEQVAFYDPGLGSKVDGGHLYGGLARWIYNTVSQATGFGITANIIDCYAALIRLWKPGDRIFLFGFSRGAYTIRCLAAVIAKCGIPTHDKDGGKLKLDVRSSCKVAAYAVKHVYQFISSRPMDEANLAQRFLLDTRELLAKRFRQDYGSACPNDPNRANVYPYFIGAFDTVAALGRPWKTLLFGGAFVAGAAIVSAVISILSFFLGFPYVGPYLAYLTFLNVFLCLFGAALLFVLGLFVYTHIKFDFRVPGYPWWKQIATIHPTAIWQKFYDYTLDDHVGYAKHAISIDENRKDFARVHWGKKNTQRPSRNPDGNIWFEQVWFSGNHADIGGGYDENESRLSDITLKWMLTWATIIPDEMRHDSSVLNLHAQSDGMQHDECKAGLGLVTKLTGKTWPEEHRKLPGDKAPYDAIMHRSVYDRFDALDVLQYDVTKPYRPNTLEQHIDFMGGYKPGGFRNPNPVAMAMYVEDRPVRAEPSAVPTNTPKPDPR